MPRFIDAVKYREYWIALSVGKDSHGHGQEVVRERQGGREYLNVGLFHDAFRIEAILGIVPWRSGLL